MIKPDVCLSITREVGPSIATTKAQRHQDLHKEKFLVPPFVPSRLCGCDELCDGVEDES